MLIIILSVFIINLTHNCLKILIQTGGLNSQFVQSWLFSHPLLQKLISLV